MDAHEERAVVIPPNRVGPLKAQWEEIYKPIVTSMKLMIRYNIKTKCVELRTTNQTEMDGAIQKAEEFIKAFSAGFQLKDAESLIKLDDIFLESFEINDVKPMLKGDHVSRAIGRIAGFCGKTKYTIENATKTRIVVAGHKISILGSFDNIQIARNAICNLILGKPPSKIYGQMRNVVSKRKR